MEYNYYLIYKQKSNREAELYFNIGGTEKSSRLLRLKGRKTPTIFNGILKTLSRTGCITPIETGRQSTYWIRDDVGPIIGTYLILIRRCRNVNYWLNFLEELLTGKFSHFGFFFANMLESAINLSKYEEKSKDYNLSPKIISSLSTALKTFIRSLKR
ncbi:hypothetical protein CW705_02795 [Candidatus Bathyarchaeota archaeon]|nr:MAG: hypothetical protein CW705_02795 [Candidatus Bathyarchaeota archaeon]